jgi:tetratricopeptide (TPR) repeat protein
VESPPAAFDEPVEALAWLDAERPNLVAAIHHALAAGLLPLAWRMVDCLRGFFLQRHYTVDWLMAANAVLAAAEQKGDLSAQSAMKCSVGNAYQRLGRYLEAAECYALALELAPPRWVDGEASVLTGFGSLYVSRGRFEDASACLDRALELCQRTGRLATEAVVHGNIGYLCRQTGKLEQAVAHCARQVTLFRQLGPANYYSPGLRCR